MTPDAFPTRLRDAAGPVEQELSAILAAPNAVGGSSASQRLLDAMRYATLAGGKRLRPLLVLEVASLFGARGSGIVRAAAAVELLHCHSLIFDDLPAMDDDDQRRGRPSLHRAFDEATATLAGSALLILAFATLGETAVHPDPEVRLELIAAMAAAAGGSGAIGGQMLDLELEGRFPASKVSGWPRDRILAALRSSHAMKTAALFRFSCEAGAILGGASSADRARIRSFGEAIGLSFQIRDDLLDLAGDPLSSLRKKRREDCLPKPSFHALVGEEQAYLALDQLAADALAIVASYGAAGDNLAAIVRFVCQRAQLGSVASVSS